MKDFKAPPKASSLIESMRDIGYSFETALADVLDNSITAEASEVDIVCDADAKEPVIAILDNGNGMSKTTLLDAMRPGSRNPLESRAEGDLGRFGLGMKTASFSQCRRLTVVTNDGSGVVAARWDLDYVAASDDWLLQILNVDEIERVPFASSLGKVGTLIVWEMLDRLSEESQKTSLKDHLYEQLDQARHHIELVFHRFLAGEKPLPAVSIRINGHATEPFDPFNSNHPATIASPEDKIRVAGADVLVQSFVLPHHSKVSKGEWNKYAGEGGYLKNQGFYVYRAGRLIVHGTWFRLAVQSELTKLARVRVDMPPELDHLWKIDVKKASASPPLVVRQRLREVIDKIAGASNRVYTYRGRKITDPKVSTFWVRRINKNQISYEINRDHPTISSFIEVLDSSTASLFESVLSIVERSIPFDALFSDVAERPEHMVAEAPPDGMLEVLVRLTVSYLKEAEMTNEEILNQLSKADPYRLNWEAAEPLVRYELGVGPDA